MNAAAATPYYADTLTLPEGWIFRWYLIPIVTLLQDVTVAEGDTLTINSDEGMELDLNGHSFDVQGTFTGSTYYGDPTYVSIDSTVPGVFRSSGTINVNLQPLHRRHRQRLHRRGRRNFPHQRRSLYRSCYVQQRK